MIEARRCGVDVVTIIAARAIACDGADLAITGVDLADAVVASVSDEDVARRIHRDGCWATEFGARGCARVAARTVGTGASESCNVIRRRRAVTAAAAREIDRDLEGRSGSVVMPISGGESYGCGADGEGRAG